MIDVRYIRTSTLLIDWDGLLLLTDPWFARRMRGLPVYVTPCVRPADLPPLDLILVSHLHPDHFDAHALARLSHPFVRLIGPPGIARRTRGLQGAGVDTLAHGQVHEEAEYTVRAFSVEHSGYENAYVVERNGMSLLFAGDARYSRRFAEIGRVCPPRVSLLPVGGTRILGRRIVMAPEDALHAAYDLRTDVVVPIHLGGEWMSVPPLSRHPGRAHHLADLAGREEAPFRVVPLAPGQRAVIRPNGSVSGPGGGEGGNGA